MLKRKKLFAVIIGWSLLISVAFTGCKDDHIDDGQNDMEIQEVDEPCPEEQEEEPKEEVRGGTRGAGLLNRETIYFDWDSYVPGERPDYAPILGINHPTDMTVLSVPSMEVTSEGSVLQLRHFTDLTELRLWDNRIDDLRALAGLVNLRILSLGSNQISDLTSLSGLTNLTELKLSDNQISDLTPLAGLTNLERLVLSGNQISDLSPLADLTSLRILELDNNQISDLTPLSGLTNLEELTLSNNQIGDMAPLENLPNLRYLYMPDNLTSVPVGFIPENDVTDSRSVEVGDIVEFGDFSWVVLDVQDNHALIITEYLHLIGIGQYNNISGMNITWQNSSLRHYFNHSLFHRFYPSERAQIQETYLVNENNPWFDIWGGDNTMDRIFLLSIQEVVYYFGDSGQMLLGPEDQWATYMSDEYDAARMTSLECGRRHFSWLRSPGAKPRLASGVDANGAIHMYGTSATSLTATVRPALWVELDFLVLD